MKLLPSALKRSLPTRILLVFIVTAALIAALVFSMLLHGFATQWRTSVNPHLARYLDYILEDIGNPPDIARARQLAAELPVNIYITGPETQYSSTGAPLDLEELEFHQHRRRFSKRKDTAFPDTNKLEFAGSHRDRTVLGSKIGDHQIYYELPHRNRGTDRDYIIGKILLGIMLLLGLCFLIFRHMLRPVQDLKAAARRMGKGELDYRVPVRADNDLGELAASINTMADDIEKMLDAKRQLLLGVSHELRSPLTRATIAVELLDKSAYTTQIRADLQEMESLLSEILESERINTRHAVIHRNEFELTALARSVLTEMSAEQVLLHAPAHSLNVMLDEARIKLLLRNLISNALKHGSTADKPPELHIQLEARQARIEMIDWGPGIAAEHLAQLTQPFYRVDSSRTRATGGFGIGLYLCKLIAEAHQGSLQISSEPGLGTRVNASMPNLSEVDADGAASGN